MIKTRLAVLLTAIIVLAVIATGYTMHAAGRQDSGGGRSGAFNLRTPGQLVFRDTEMGPNKDHLAAVPARNPGGARAVSDIACARFYAAAGTGVCLRNRPGLTPAYDAVVLDASLHETHRYPGTGIPSRVRVSASGRMAAWTVFVSGDSYGGAFSTRTSVLDTRTGHLVSSLEDFSITKGGSSYRSPDVNYWGVTFADDDRFYATLATKGKTYLVQGEVGARRVRTLHENVECPSLSPDGTRVVYKKKVKSVSSGSPWRLYALSLKTMQETPLAEPRNIDDQAVWLNDSTVVYALPGDFGTDLWTIPADGTGAPRELVGKALAPAFS